jgi:hypothetical protein
MCNDIDVSFKCYINKNKEVCPYELLFGYKTKLPTYLKSFGKIVVVKAKVNIQSRLKNRGTTCMCAGYSVHHANDLYRI